MYARYVPPLKGSEAVKDSEKIPSPPAATHKPSPPSTPSRHKTAQVETVDAGGSSYGRFIPNKRIVSNQSQSHRENVEEKSLEKEASPVPKPERDFRNHLTRSQDLEGSELAQESENKLKLDDLELDEARKVKKAKKRKAKEQAEGSDDDDDEEEEEVNRRHKAVLKRKEKSLQLANEAPKEDIEMNDRDEELHELEPLPQPEQTQQDRPKPSYDGEPDWIKNPLTVDQGAQKPFAELGLPEKAVKILREKGYPDAFAVQTAVIPLLLPSSRRRPGDVLISAATGSGKTLAYALPIVRDLSQELVTRLRVLVVLPTRELVKQAQETFELCAQAFEDHGRKNVQIGISVGNQSLKYEQQALIASESRYDPAARLEEETKTRETITGLNSMLKNPRIGKWEGEVIDFSSKADVLICTPGRLVEHMEQTPGFSLDYVRWLVMDEADRLLAQRFQGWLELVLEACKSTKRNNRDFPDMNLSGVRKVILSATLKPSLDTLSQLRLRRPQFVKLQGAFEHSLPGGLQEFAIRVLDENLKPLYLMELLKGPYMSSEDPSAVTNITQMEDASDSDATSDTSSSSSSSSSSLDESETLDSDSDTGTDSVSDMSVDTPGPTTKSNLNIRVQAGTCLVFTKSNESALRLSRLLCLLDPSFTAQVGTLTSATPFALRRKTLAAFTSPSSPVRVVIASDLVSRGIDIAALDHVINYDLPASSESYVHRVGRTARAGRQGRAWTLVGDGDSGWFWGKIGKSTAIGRQEKIKRLIWDARNEKDIVKYEHALEKLGDEAKESRNRR